LILQPLGSPAAAAAAAVVAAAAAAIAVTDFSNVIRMRDVSWE